MSTPFGVHTSLNVVVVGDAKEAIRQGYFYRPPVYLPIRIAQAVVVRKGTAQGKPTVDLVLETESGQKHVVMLTAELLRSLVAAAFSDDVGETAPRSRGLHGARGGKVRATPPTRPGHARDDTAPT